MIKILFLLSCIFKGSRCFISQLTSRKDLSSSGKWKKKKRGRERVKPIYEMFYILACILGDSTTGGIRSRSSGWSMGEHVNFSPYTVLPRLSGPRLSAPSLIRTLACQLAWYPLPDRNFKIGKGSSRRFQSAWLRLLLLVPLLKGEEKCLVWKISFTY